jgi:hypothetical protein
MDINSISETISNSFCDRRIHFAGIVETTKSRLGGIEIVDVLRKVDQERNFVPVVYEGGVLAFITIDNEIVFNSNRNGIIDASLIVISDSYGDHKSIIANLDRYDFSEVRLTLDSQNIYNRYFEENDNKPFQGYAFEIKLQFSDNYQFCCESFTRDC